MAPYCYFFRLLRTNITIPMTIVAPNIPIAQKAFGGSNSVFDDSGDCVGAGEGERVAKEVGLAMVT